VARVAKWLSEPVMLMFLMNVVRLAYLRRGSVTVLSTVASLPPG
jgi:hypothetical protein